MHNFKVTVTARIEKTVSAHDERHAKNIVNAWLRDTVLPGANPKELFVFTTELASQEAPNFNPEKPRQ